MFSDICFSSDQLLYRASILFSKAHHQDWLNDSQITVYIQLESIRKMNPVARLEEKFMRIFFKLYVFVVENYRELV